MAIGPAQLTLPGINHDEIHGEPERLRGSETLRALGALVVYNDVAGAFEIQHLGQLSEDEAIEVFDQIWAAVGPDIEGEEETGWALRRSGRRRSMASMYPYEQVRNVLAGNRERLLLSPGGDGASLGAAAGRPDWLAAAPCATTPP